MVGIQYKYNEYTLLLFFSLLSIIKLILCEDKYNIYTIFRLSLGLNRPRERDIFLFQHVLREEKNREEKRKKERVIKQPSQLSIYLPCVCVCIYIYIYIYILSIILNSISLTHNDAQLPPYIFIYLLTQNDNKLSFRISNSASIVWKKAKKLIRSIVDEDGFSVIWSTLYFICCKLVWDHISCSMNLMST
jgi:hypothetical protein